MPRISASPLNFCNKKQEIEAGTWVAGIARFRILCGLYWLVMHAKALVREKKNLKTIKEQKGQIINLRNCVFGKNSEKKSSNRNNGQLKNLA